MFKRYFEKAAGEPVGIRAIGKALISGAKESGKQEIGEILKLKHLRHITEAVKKNEGVGKSFSTQAGRERLAKGLGKALPSMAAAGAYGAAAHKVYKKMSPDDTQDGYYY